MTKRRTPPNRPVPRPDPITAREVSEWFKAAALMGDIPAAVADFAAVAERFRRHNSVPPDTELLERLRNREGARRSARTLLNQVAAHGIDASSRDPARAAVIAKLLSALRDFCNLPPEGRAAAHRRTLQRTGQIIVLSEILAKSISADTPKKSRRAVLRHALTRCGWNDLPSAEIGKLLARPNRERAPLLAAALVAWGIIAIKKGQPHETRGRKAGQE